MAIFPFIDQRDVDFVLYEMLEVHKLNRLERYGDFDRDIFESTIELAARIASEQIYPANAIGEKEGASFNPDTYETRAPGCFKPIMAAVNEAGFSGISSSPEWGGMGMPEVIKRAVLDYFFSAGAAFTVYITLSTGAANLVKNFATEEDKKKYLEKMVSGQWGGTMCLTEPEAGSDVGALKTKAVKQADGTYLISGQKIFITSGDNDLYENIIHPVLARIEGDPQGTRGISIFLVPKYHVNPDGTLGEMNDMVCSGIEHKMGLKGSATCSLNFGDNGKCIGYLMGREREGMKIMFQMMNEARLDTSQQGLGVSSAAYMHAVTYARTRIQGKDPSGDSRDSVPIIKHPDVKRMLLWMKANVEAMRMLTYYTAYNIDLAHNSEGDAALEAQAIVDFLIPVCKAGNTDLGWLITGEAIQVYGGHGYIAEHPVEKLARDSKIFAIWEGTNGIQSLDLAMRKLLLNPDMFNYSVYKKRIKETLEEAGILVDENYTRLVEKGLAEMDRAVSYLNGLKESGNLPGVFANATPLQQCFRMLTHAWMHLRCLALCIPRLEDILGDQEGRDREAVILENKEAAYYSGKIAASRFFIGNEFLKYFGLIDTILSGNDEVVKITSELFSGAPEE